MTLPIPVADDLPGDREETADKDEEECQEGLDLSVTGVSMPIRQSVDFAELKKRAHAERSTETATPEQAEASFAAGGVLSEMATLRSVPSSNNSFTTA